MKANHSKLSEAFKQGKAAHKRGKAFNENPFSLNTQMMRYEEWHNGWMDANGTPRVMANIPACITVL